MQHLESNLQKACVRYFRYQYPEYLIYANGNGGFRSKIEAGIMQGEGVTAGIPDLTIVAPNLVIWVEMKTEKGKATENQRSMMQRIAGYGHPVHICRSLDDFSSICKLHFKTN